MQNILVTGGRGGIGGRLMSRLSKLGHAPVSYDVADGKDILDSVQLEADICRADVVYHLAAQANLNFMRDLNGAANGVALNVLGTANVAHLCAKHGKFLIFISTICVYGDVGVYPILEDETLPNPSEIYAASKYSAEWIVRGYGINFSLPYTILRIATTYGPGCCPELGVHVFLKQALHGEPITVHGDGTQERTLTYVEDIVDGLVSPLSRMDSAAGNIFNISSSERVTAIGMARLVKEVTGSDSEIVFVPQRPHNTLHEHIAVSKARRLLKWQAKTEFRDGLQSTLEWMKDVSVK